MYICVESSGVIEGSDRKSCYVHLIHKYPCNAPILLSYTTCDSYSHGPFADKHAPSSTSASAIPIHTSTIKTGLICCTVRYVAQYLQLLDENDLQRTMHVMLTAFAQWKGMTPMSTEEIGTATGLPLQHCERRGSQKH